MSMGPPLIPALMQLTEVESLLKNGLFRACTELVQIYFFSCLDSFDSTDMTSTAFAGYWEL